MSRKPGWTWLTDTSLGAGAEVATIVPTMFTGVLLPRHHTMLGNFLLTRQNHRAAAMQFRKLVAGSPDDGLAHYMLSLSLYETGDREGALRMITRAYDLAIRQCMVEITQWVQSTYQGWFDHSSSGSGQSQGEPSPLGNPAFMPSSNCCRNTSVANGSSSSSANCHH